MFSPTAIIVKTIMITIEPSAGTKSPISGVSPSVSTYCG
jgi:hypothetical protein